MKTARWTTTLALMAFAAAPVGAQQMGGMGHQHGMMGQGTAQACSAMAAGEGMMGGMMGMMMGGQAMSGRMGMMGAGEMGVPGMTGGGGMMGMSGMMGSAGFGPSALLGAADQLALTADQKSSLESLVTKSREGWQAHMQAAMAARSHAAETLHGDSPDLDAYGEALREAADQMVEAQVGAASASLEAQELLTPEQSEKLQDSMQLMGSMMCGAWNGAMGDAAPSSGSEGGDLQRQHHG